MLSGADKCSCDTGSSSCQQVRSVASHCRWQHVSTVWHACRHEAAVIMASVGVSWWQCLDAGAQCCEQSSTHRTPTPAVQHWSALWCWSHCQSVGHLEGMHWALLNSNEVATMFIWPSKLFFVLNINHTIQWSTWVNKPFCILLQQEMMEVTEMTAASLNTLTARDMLTRPFPG